jgi:4-hydroxy-tetrahydrodipicolinate synthase
VELIKPKIGGVMFSGVGTALITPFDENEDVDYISLRKIIRFQLDNSIDALIVLGTTGESPVIDLGERKKIIEMAITEVNGKVPVIVGTGTNDARDVIRQNKIAEELGADGLLIVNPYYNKGTQASLIQHYKFICGQTSLPVILYNVPSRTGMNLLPETAVRIYDECSNVVGIKEASGDISQIARLFSIKPEEFIVFSGNDDQALPILALGSVGVISVFSNPYPYEMKQIINAFENNDLPRAQNLQNNFIPMMNALFIETSPMPVKYVMHKLGFCQHKFRLPLTEISDASMMLLDKEIERLNEISMANNIKNN